VSKKLKELKELSKEELATKVRETEAALFQLRMQHRTGQLENTAMLWQNRKMLARIKSLLGSRAAAK
jgi:large subunit ribosomal protein L29